MNHFLRIYDYEVSQRPDILIANSKNIASRIKKFYRRDSVVIYPPVSLMSFPRKAEKSGSPIKSGMTRSYFLSLGRLVRGKGTEVIVEAATKLGLPLKVVGTGPELERLKKIAGSSVEFLGQIKDEDLFQIYSKAKALVVASEDEDFGITSVEAQSVGTPVIAVRAGGYLESVIEGKTGEFFDKADVESLTKVLENFDPKKFKPEELRKNAEKFSKEKFKKELKDLIEKNFHRV